MIAVCHALSANQLRCFLQYPHKSVHIVHMRVLRQWRPRGNNVAQSNLFGKYNLILERAPHLIFRLRPLQPDMSGRRRQPRLLQHFPYVLRRCAEKTRKLYSLIPELRNFANRSNKIVLRLVAECIQLNADKRFSHRVHHPD
ncbi:hypothetical protein D3C84_917150 [compost metagenome]